MLRYCPSICLKGLSLGADCPSYKTRVSGIYCFLTVVMLFPFVFCTRFHVLENGTLLVQEVHMADSGKYGCTAGNSGGFKRE
jgi:hypothetical protein